MSNVQDRPQRQRKSVCHYSDDNPNTFTVKIRKGDQKHIVDDGRSDDSVVLEHSVKRPRVFPRSKHAINNQAQQFSQSDSCRVSEEDMIVTSLDAAKGQTLPRRRGRPPRRPSNDDSTSSSSCQSSSAVGTIRSTAPRTKMTTKLAAQKVEQIPTIPLRRKKRVRILMSSTSSSSKPSDEIICHTAAVQPVFPIEYNSKQCRINVYDAIINEERKPPPPSDWVHLEVADKPPKSLATSISSRPVGRPRNSTSQNAFPPQSIPVDVTASTIAPAISITAIASRQYPLFPPQTDEFQFTDSKNHISDKNIRRNAKEWIILGDCRGSVSLWMVGHQRPLCRVSTAACQREEGRVILSKKVISYPNAIQQTAWSYSDIVLVLTETDLEGIRIVPPQQFRGLDIDRADPCQNRLFLVNVSQAPSRSINVSIQFHFNFRRPLILWSTAERSIVDENTEGFAISDSNNTLACLEIQATSNVGMKWTPVAPDGLQFFRCLSALWDASMAENQECDSGSDSFLVVALTSLDSLEVMRLMIHHENKSSTVIERQPVALLVGRGMNLIQTECTMQQIPSDNYRLTVLCGNRTAIQLLDSRSLVCLASFGKSISLHGKQVQWKACYWVPFPPNRDSLDVVRENEGKLKHQIWIERHDEVASRLEISSNEKASENLDGIDKDQNIMHNARGKMSVNKHFPSYSHPFWLVGIPHPSKGPEELNSTMYIWKHPLVGVASEDGAIFDFIFHEQKLYMQQQVDSTSIRLPMGGCLGLSVASANNDLEILCVTAAAGQLYQKRASLITDFAGVMYPVGYQVVDDNIEYIEDEHEMDQSIIIEEVKDDLPDISIPVSPKPRGRPKKNPVACPLASSTQDEHKGARDCLDASLVEPVERMEDMLVAVKDDFDDEDDGRAFRAPCWPSSEVILSSNRKECDFHEEQLICDLLKYFPQHESVCLLSKLRQPVPSAQHRDSSNGVNSIFCSDVQSTCSSSTITVNNSNLIGNTSKLIKNKRTRMASVETTLQSAIDQDLRAFMSSERGKWSDPVSFSARRQLHDLTTSRDSKMDIQDDVVDDVNVESEARVLHHSALTQQKHQKAMSKVIKASGEPEKQPIDNRKRSSPSLTNSLITSDQHTSTTFVSHDQSDGLSINGPCRSDENLDHEDESPEKTKKDHVINSSEVRRHFQHVSSELVCDNRDEVDLGSELASLKPVSITCEEGDLCSSDPVCSDRDRKMFCHSGIEPSMNVLPLGNNLPVKKMEAGKISFENGKTQNECQKLASTSELVDNKTEEKTEEKLQTENYFPDVSKSIAHEPVEGSIVFSTSSQHANDDNKFHIYGDNAAPLSRCLDTLQDIQSQYAASVVTLPAKLECGGNFSVVTPSEASPAHPNVDELILRTKTSSESCCEIKSSCPACRGRLVVHTCGKRDKPIDYEAIAREERERKERQAAEKALARAEKRRMADAKRRETKRLKKHEEDERKRCEEEEIRRLEKAENLRKEQERLEMEDHERRLRFEEEKKILDDIERSRQVQDLSLNEEAQETSNGGDHRFVDTSNNSWEVHGEESKQLKSMYYDGSYSRQDEDLTYTNKVPSYRMINQLSVQGSDAGDDNLFESDNWDQNERYSNGIYQRSPLAGSNRVSITIDGTRVQPSTSIDPLDALAALAGLADSMRIAQSDITHYQDRQESSLHVATSNASVLDNGEESDYYNHESSRSRFPYEYSEYGDRPHSVHRPIAGSDLVARNTVGNASYVHAGTASGAFASDYSELAVPSNSIDGAEYDAIIGSATGVGSDWGKLSEQHYEETESSKPPATFTSTFMESVHWGK